ncbi:hypothetical protein BX661DRAFT_196842 [Kickxella alabastrina]|uniref:uncharacterized protein n=1 Tax=Kickxella alabastrina TaxID=61397 RepID=UPI00221EC3ED|nr:uncharacterized protein BX661DRAFT_196842 [Kickxella alabastrina]KAI7832960.1 hypothetical protein BX661DRAFT_196842 [Kickxella alabastrina]KAJ1936695.1 hypothetical protein GGF37_005504 [Kickxella alabastrina]
MSYFNRHLVLLIFNILNIVAFIAIISVAVVNIVDHTSATNLIIYHGYTGLLSLSLIISEFRVPSLLNSQARFLFTYTGRGLILTYFGCIVYTNRIYNVVACIYTVSLGVIYLVIAWLPFVPLQHGIVYNWSKWCQEGAWQFYDKQQAVGNDNSGDPIRGGERKLKQPGSLLAHELNPKYAAAAGPCDSSQSLWTESLVESTPGQPRGSPLAADRNESFVYGLTMDAKKLQTTGDEYLDSIVNSSRFARDIMDHSESIVVRDCSTPSRPYSRGLSAEGEMPLSGMMVYGERPHSGLMVHDRPHSRLVMHGRPRSGQMAQGDMPLCISSPIPYHVYAPESRESLHENMRRISMALDSDPTSP